MSDNNAHKRAARALQAANPGMSYTRALRAVSNGQRRPLTAQLGLDHAGNPVVVNLESLPRGGSGPHCLLTGDDHNDVRDLLAHLAAALVTDQPKGDVALIVGAAEPIGLTVDHLRLDSPTLISHVDGIFDQRWQLLKSLAANDIADVRIQGHHLSTIVLLLDEHEPGHWLASRAVQRWSRQGRSVGIHLIVGTQVEPPAGLCVDHAPEDKLKHVVESAIAHTVLANVSTTISVYGGGRGTLRTPGQWQPEHRLQRADVLTDFTFTPANPGRGSAPDGQAG